MNRLQLSQLLRLPIIGFFLALLGLVCNAIGWYVVDSRTVAILGFLIIVVGIVVGVLGVAIGQWSSLSDWKESSKKRDR
jgi:sulfite exporter TauE/SafE